MRESIELNPELGPAIVPGTIMQELYAHARDAAPEECCGLITGTDENLFRASHRITNVMTKMHLADPERYPRDSHRAYYMAESEVLAVTRAAEERGEHVTAVYHSHVSMGIYLSEDDLAFAEHPLFPFQGAAQLVVSVVDPLTEPDRVSHDGSASEKFVEGAGLFLYDRDAGAFERAGGRRIEISDA